MSYSFTLRTENGQTVLEDISGDVPDGIHRVSGHEDISRIDLSVTRNRADGRHIASATHTHTRET